MTQKIMQNKPLQQKKNDTNRIIAVKKYLDEYMIKNVEVNGFYVYAVLDISSDGIYTSKSLADVELVERSKVTLRIAVSDVDIYLIDKIGD